MPEHPPPTTRILRPHSGLPSSSRRSEIFFAAVSVSEIMHSSLEINLGSINVGSTSVGSVDVGSSGDPQQVYQSRRSPGSSNCGAALPFELSDGLGPARGESWVDPS